MWSVPPADPEQKGTDMNNLELQKCTLGPVMTNCYFLKNRETGEMLIVDPGDSPDTVIAKVREMQGTPVGILLTHGHFDHILAVEEVKKEFGVSVYAWEKEASTLEKTHGEPFRISGQSMFPEGGCGAFRISRSLKRPDSLLR